MAKWLALLMFSVTAYGQQNNVSQIPDCSLGTCAGNGIPTFACNSGQKYARVDTPGNNYTCTGFPHHWVADVGNSGDVITSPAGTINVGGTSAATTLEINLTRANTWTNGMSILNGLTLDTLAFTTASEGVTFPLGSQIFETNTNALVVIGNVVNLGGLSGAVNINAGGSELNILGAGDGVNPGGAAILQTAGGAHLDSTYEMYNNGGSGFSLFTSVTGELLSSDNSVETQLGAEAGTYPLAFIKKVGIGNVTTTIANTNIKLQGNVTILGPATAPTGACSPNGTWVFSQDGKGTVCIAGTWVTKVT